MIKTKIIEEYGGWQECLERVLKRVNELIKEKGINKADIIEYRTEKVVSFVGYSRNYSYRATISWFQHNS